MNGERSPSESEALSDEHLAECLDCLDRGKELGQEMYANLEPGAAKELEEFLRYADFLNDAVQPISESTDSGAEQESDVAPEVSNPDELWKASTIQYSADSSCEIRPPESPEIIGQAGDYVLLKELGRGGMGVVFKARQVNLNRTVAVKMILAGRMASDRDLQRFYSEARAVARLHHPNIVSIYDVQVHEGHHYYSMDFIEGRTLEEVAREETLSERQIARYVNLIADAVEYAHQNGILHRDLKPANVLIDEDDEPHVTDFGLAKVLEDDSGLTQSGTILGTPSFMSPEQAAGHNDELGPASDVYALGAILYSLLTGHPPFRGRTGAETIHMVINDQPQPVRSYNPRVSRQLVTICEKCLSKDPKDRYQSAQELAVELERFLRGDPIQAHRINVFRRAWVWCRDIPLVAGLIGRTPSSSNHWQKRLQWSLLSLAAILGVFWIVHAIRAAILPDEIVIASGMRDGMYQGVAEKLAEAIRRTTDHQVRVLQTEGSIENGSLLVAGKAHLGLLQGSAVDIDQVAVVAPLYVEYAHLIVRRDSDIKAIGDLKDKTIWVGPDGSGNRVSAIKILKFFDVNGKNSTFSAEEHFDAVQSNRSIKAAVVVTGLENTRLIKLLETGDFRLLPIPSRFELFQATGFYPGSLSSGDYPDAFDSEEKENENQVAEISTVSTAALLVVHEGERNVIVHAACECLVRDGLLESLARHFSADEFRYLTKSLPMHPAASRFFKSKGPAASSQSN